ncbi:MAG: 16S rRNA (guanine(966)-N(2))-methyltransferase RsmD [Cellulosilyticaceae bacterium]
MRVISGKCRGTNLVAPEGMTTRPTVDRIKETLFNIISFDIPQCNFLDLFSGSGAIGIESLSRGASRAVFVEKDKEALKCICKNLEKTRLTGSAIVYNEEVLNVIRKLGQKREQFDIVFMDPPYALEQFEMVLSEIVANDLLMPNGYIIVERATERPIKPVESLVCTKEKSYRTTTLSFFERK